MGRGMRWGRNGWLSAVVAENGRGAREKGAGHEGDGWAILGKGKGQGGDEWGLLGENGVVCVGGVGGVVGKVDGMTAMAHQQQ